MRPNVLVRICDECNYGSYQARFFRSNKCVDMLSINMFRVAALFAEARVFLTLTTAKNVFSVKKTYVSANQSIGFPLFAH